jgi:hypothetical protein
MVVPDAIIPHPDTAPPARPQLVAPAVPRSSPIILQQEAPEFSFVPPIMPHEQSLPQSTEPELPQEHPLAPAGIIAQAAVFPVPRIHVPPVVFIVLKGESGEAAKAPAGIRSAARSTRINNFDMG